MTIGHAVQKGSLIYIYDQQGKQIMSVSAPGRWPEDGLKSYTSNAVSVQKGTLIYRYDAAGHMVGRPFPAQQMTAPRAPKQFASA